MPDAPSPAPRRSPWPWLILALAIIAAPTYLAVRLLGLFEKAAAAPAAVAQRLADAFRPSVQIHTTIASVLGQFHSESKLVVLTQEVSVQVTKEDEKRTLWGKVYLGTTTVQVRARGNRVQYYVPLQDISPDSLTFDRDANRLTLTVPAPRLDESFVDIQSDPSQIEIETDVGWARLDRYSGQFLRDQARRDLRPAVLEQGRNPLVQDKARSEAQRLLESKLHDLLAPTLREGVQIQVRFHPTP